eukprot:c25013_g7_i3 orf=192-596(+)
MCGLHILHYIKKKTTPRLVDNAFLYKISARHPSVCRPFRECNVQIQTQFYPSMYIITHRFEGISPSQLAAHTKQESPVLVSHLNFLENQGVCKTCIRHRVKTFRKIHKAMALLTICCHKQRDGSLNEVSLSYLG